MIDFGYGITLEPVNKQDVQMLRLWRNDPRIYRWSRQNDLISDLQQDNWYETMSKDPTIKMYIVSDEGGVSGCCGFTSIDSFNQRAEFSIYIAPDIHNEGLGKKALKTLLAHGFYDLNLNCIWGETFDGNTALSLFEGLGMKREGYRREFYYKGGSFIGAYLVSMVKSEWKEQCKAWG